MDLSDEDGPCKLLFVSRTNLPKIVRQVAPDMVLIPRKDFERIAMGMLEIVESAT